MTMPPQYSVPQRYGQVPPGYGSGYEPMSPAGQPLAAFDKRLVAVIIDSVILGAVSLVVAGPLYAIGLIRLLAELERYTNTNTNTNAVGTAPETVPLSAFGEFFALLGVAFVVLLAANYVYYVELALRNGQTPGKRIMKIRIVPLDPSQPLTRSALAARYFTTLGLSLLPIGNWIDGLWQLWDKPYQQCLHDKAAKTAVVRLST